MPWTRVVPPPTRETQTRLLEPDEQKRRVNQMLRQIVSKRDARYYLDDKFIRWGRVEADLVAIIEGREFEEVCYDGE